MTKPMPRRKPLPLSRKEKIAHAVALYAEGHTIRDVADRLHVSKTTATRFLREAGVAIRHPGERTFIFPTPEQKTADMPIGSLPEHHPLQFIDAVILRERALAEAAERRRAYRKQQEMAA